MKKNCLLKWKSLMSISKVYGKKSLANYFLKQEQLLFLIKETNKFRVGKGNVAD